MSSLLLMLTLIAEPAPLLVTEPDVAPSAAIAVWSYYDYNRLRQMRDVAPRFYHGWMSVRDAQGIIDEPTPV